MLDMTAESEVEVITVRHNVKKLVGYSYIAGYALGSVVGCIAAKPKNITNNVTKHNRYLGNLFATTATLVCAATYIANYLRTITKQ